ncbi:DUF4870 domain-containing protein [Flavobacterium sp.]|uniref:DUF4870 domain-containing protein n=1 Tax=Flavobacterium sp. TaxID=239 RepID=UPI0038FC05A5
MNTTSENNLATFTHLSSLSQYFIPFGNIIFPLLIWNSKKEDSEFIDHNGKQVLNFQLSILFYTLIIAMIATPIIIIKVINEIPLKSIYDNEEFIFNTLIIEHFSGIIIFALLTIFTLIGLKIAEFILIIYASLKTSNGEKYQYPLTISFIK